jgi:hypothetical protein
MGRQIGSLGIALALAAALLGAPPARALTFNLVPFGNITAAQLAALEEAAGLLEPYFPDPITVHVAVRFGSLTGPTLASTSSQLTTHSLVSTLSAMHLDAAPGLEKSAVAQLPSPTVPVTRLVGTSNDSRVTMTTANAKALGLGTVIDETFGYQAPIGFDARITFSDSTTWDLDRSNGIATGSTDLVSVAAHEFGHVLGFTSAVDNSDLNPLAALHPATLDLWRFDETGSPHAVGSAARMLTANKADFDNTTMIEQLSHGVLDASDPTCGTTSGRCQASHWQDDGGHLMDPTIGAGVQVNPSYWDIRALDYIGYNGRSIKFPSGKAQIRRIFSFPVSWPDGWPEPAPPQYHFDDVPKDAEPVRWRPTHSFHLHLESEVPGIERRSAIGALEYRPAEFVDVMPIRPGLPGGFEPGFEDLNPPVAPLEELPPRIVGFFLKSDRDGTPFTLRSSGEASFDPTIGRYGGFRISGFVDAADDRTSDDDALVVLVLPLPDAGALAALEGAGGFEAALPATAVESRISVGDWQALGASDRDGDGEPDALDNCPFHASADQTDTDGDGRGDPCECGDQNGDGHNTVADLVAINRAIFSRGLITELCDANNDGACSVGDIVAANAEIFSPGSTSTCGRQPVPEP